MSSVVPTLPFGAGSGFPDPLGAGGVGLLFGPASFVPLIDQHPLIRPSPQGQSQRRKALFPLVRVRTGCRESPTRGLLAREIPIRLTRAGPERALSSPPRLDTGRGPGRAGVTGGAGAVSRPPRKLQGWAVERLGETGRGIGRGRRAGPPQSGARRAALGSSLQA